MSDDKEILTTEEAAEHLSLSASSLTKWRMQGIGPVFVKYGEKSVRYKKCDLDAFVEEKRVGG